MVVVWYARDLYDFFRSLKKIRDTWPSLQDAIGHIINALISLQQSMNTLMAEREDRYSQANSPQQLNETGVAMSKEINAKSIAKKYAHLVQIKEGANAYDIQETCFHFALHSLPDQLTADEKDKIKNVAFEQGGNAETILRVVVGIVLRDEILEKRDLTPDHVDAAQPKK